MAVDFNPLKKEHIDRIDAPEGEKEHLRNIMKVNTNYVAVEYNGEILFIIGYQRVNYDVAMIYVCTDRGNLKKYKRVFHRTIKMMEKDFAETMCIRKLLATTPQDCHTSMRWIRSLGFQIEGVIKSFVGDNEDHVLYGRVVQCS